MNPQLYDRTEKRTEYRDWDTGICTEDMPGNQ